MSAPNIEDAPLPQGVVPVWTARLRGLREQVEQFLEAERGQLPLWAVAGFGAGMGLWFALPMAFAAFIAGLLWLCLWSTRVRLFGLFPIAIGAAAAAAAPAPDLLVTGDGRHLALLDGSGRPAMLRDRSGDFIRSLISENSGFDCDPSAVASMPLARCSRDACIVDVRRSGRSSRVLATRSGQRIDWADVTRACAASDIVVSDRWLPRACTPNWLKLDRKALESAGGMAIYLAGDEPRVVTVAERVGVQP